MKKRLAVVAVLLVLLASFPIGEEKKDEILERFLSQESEPILEYVARREISARNMRFNASGQMQIETTFRNKKLSYKVLNQTGSEFILGKIRGGLDDEVKEPASYF